MLVTWGRNIEFRDPAARSRARWAQQVAQKPAETQGPAGRNRSLFCLCGLTSVGSMGGTIVEGDEKGEIKILTEDSCAEYAHYCSGAILSLTVRTVGHEDGSWWYSSCWMQQLLPITFSDNGSCWQSSCSAIAIRPASWHKSHRKVSVPCLACHVKSKFCFALWIPGTLRWLNSSPLSHDDNNNSSTAPYPVLLLLHDPSPERNIVRSRRRRGSARAKAGRVNTLYR